MDRLVCPKCNEENVGSAFYCSNCGGSLKDAQAVRPADKTYERSKNSKIDTSEAGTEKTGYGMLVVGVLFALIPAAVLIGANTAMPLTGRLFCGLPILFGLGLFVFGIDMVRRPEKYVAKETPAGSGAVQTATQAQVRCSVCNRTNADYLRELKRKDPNVYIYSTHFIGICPVCKKAYCVEHAAYSGEIDHEVCPVHQEKLTVV